MTLTTAQCYALRVSILRTAEERHWESGFTAWSVGGREEARLVWRPMVHEGRPALLYRWGKWETGEQGVFAQVKGAGAVVVSARSRKMMLTLCLRSEELALRGRCGVHRLVADWPAGPSLPLEPAGHRGRVGAALAVIPAGAGAVLDGAGVDVHLVHGSGLGRAGANHVHGLSRDLEGVQSLSDRAVGGSGLELLCGHHVVLLCGWCFALGRRSTSYVTNLQYHVTICQYLIWS
jgi:hypothetical protein